MVTESLWYYLTKRQYEYYEERFGKDWVEANCKQIPDLEVESGTLSIYKYKVSER